MLNLFLKQFFSIPCPCCKKNVAETKNIFCEDCFNQLKLISAPRCPGCGGKMDSILNLCSKCLKEEDPSWNKAISLIEMKGKGREIIERFKYRNDIVLARPLARLAVETIKKENIDVDYIISVPLHWLKFLARGYNQVELVTKLISNEIKIPLKYYLKRCRYTKSQTKLTGIQRRTNIYDAFIVTNKRKVKDRKILLVDDVFTTGSTLRAASRKLIDAGAKEVIVLTFARR